MGKFTKIRIQGMVLTAEIRPLFGGRFGLARESTKRYKFDQVLTEQQLKAVLKLLKGVSVS